MTISYDIPSQTTESLEQITPSGKYSFFAKLTAEPPALWNTASIGGLISLVIIWAAWFYGTWATWGWLTADCGREMFVPTVLREGKTLYKDIWYLYGPLAPYWNSFLFRLFGTNLSVLYWAGSLSALGSAILLYLSGMRLAAPLAGWTAGAVLLTQSFQRSLFSFPLPYSFASVYGCLTACLFLWLMIRAADSRSPAWVLGTSTAAAVALLLKLEFGAACYAALALLILARWFRARSWKTVGKDVAACLPGIAVCGIVLIWMISLGGVQFLTQENLMSWPSSYFMRTYGKFWLAETGLSLSANAFAKAAHRTIFLLGIFQGLHLLVSWKRATRRLIFLRALLFLGALLSCAMYVVAIEYTWHPSALLRLQDAMRIVFLPQDMVLYAGFLAGFAWWYVLRNRASDPSPAAALTLTFSTVLALRTLLLTTPWGYSIFYNGPAVLSLLLLAWLFIRQTNGSRKALLLRHATLCVMCLTAVVFNTNRQPQTSFQPTARLTTERGTIRVSPNFAEQYSAAIQFMKEKRALGEEVLSVPEDASLYFLSATHPPTRVFTFDPGVLAPGKMTDETIQQIERKPVRYLIWSNLLYPEYRALRFGVDFDQPLGRYLFSHYHRVRLLVPRPVPFGEWNAYIWERNVETKPAATLLAHDGDSSLR